MNLPTFSRREALIASCGLAGGLALQTLWDLGSVLVSAAVQATRNTPTTPDMVGPFEVYDTFGNRQILVDRANERIISVDNKIVRTSSAKISSNGATLDSEDIETFWGRQTPITAGLEIQPSQAGLTIVDKLNSKTQELPINVPKGSLISVNNIILEMEGGARDALLIISTNDSEIGAKLLVRKRDGSAELISVDLNKKNRLTEQLQREVSSHQRFSEKIKNEHAYDSYSEETARALNANPSNFGDALPLQYHQPAIKRYADEIAKESKILKQLNS